MKKPKQESKTVISHCNFVGPTVTIDADTLATVNALAEAARQNAVALTEAARAIQKATHTPGPLLQFGLGA